MRRGRRQHGIILMDLAMACVVIAALVLVLAQAVALQRKSSVRLAEQRTLTAIAQRTLTSLQMAQKPTVLNDGAKVTLRLLEGAAPEGQLWVEVSVKNDEASATLIGQVSRAAADAFIKEAGE